VESSWRKDITWIQDRFDVTAVTAAAGEPGRFGGSQDTGSLMEKIKFEEF